MEIAIALLRHYGFDFGGYTTNDLVRAWSSFDPEWVRQAIIEALFQGRYKAISVNQILIFWERKGEIICHHNREFERLICGDFSTISGEPTYPEVTAETAKPVLEISPFIPQEITTPITRRKVSEIAPHHQNFGFQIEPLGTTAPIRLSLNKSPLPTSQVYRSAYENMTLLAESSIFVDKLRSICTSKTPVMSAEMSQNEQQAVEIF